MIITRLPISVIILTYNEEKNIEDCLKSVYDWVGEIFIVDSFSTDKTLEIVKKYTDKIYQHHFENYSIQRNWAFKNLPIKFDWILNLDADHRVTNELIKELIEILSYNINKEVNGYMISRKTVFMGKWIKYGGHYPVYHNLLFKKGKGKCENRFYDQHFIVEGKSLKLKSDIIDVISDSVGKFCERHIKWAAMEAGEQILSHGKGEVQPTIWGTPIQRRRLFRNYYNTLPLFLRAFLYFIYRYFFRLGFLDGKEGIIFHFLQGFWYRFLVDAKIYEIEKKAKMENKDVKQVIKEMYGIEF